MPTPEEFAYWDYVAKSAITGETDINYWKNNQILRRLLKWNLWGSNVLEIGAGMAMIALNLMNMMRFHYVGCEISEEFRKYAKDKSGLDLLPNAADRLPTSAGAVDYLFAFDVLEHIATDDRDSSYRELGRVLKPGALMFIHNPCEGHYQGHKKKFDPGFNLHDLQHLIDVGGLKLSEIEAYAIDIPVKEGKGHREYQWITLVKK